MRAGIRLLALAFVILVAASSAAAEPVRLQLDTATSDTLRSLLGLAPGQEIPLRDEPRYPVVRYQVSFESFDGLIINADYAHSARNPSAPTLILQPNMRSSRRDYDRFQEFLLENGFSYLAFDLRGYGGSQYRNDGTAIDTRAMENDIEGTEFRNMSRDIEAALDWLMARNLVKSGGVFIIGDRIGGTAAAMGLVDYATEVRGAVLFSPVRSFRRINLDDRLSRIQGRPILLLAPAEDRAATTAARQIQSANPNIRTEILHNVEPRIMLCDSPQAQEEIMSFIASVLRPRQNP
ncbi:MAG: alpha/beta hydrolase [Candidatus Sumerlaeia bacterium]|nr:alpha/beta hydrolase [Candidatus Sumerlaeia bacterium]